LHAALGVAKKGKTMSRLLTFEYDRKAETIEIHGDEEGLKSLIQALEKLIVNTKEGHFNHDHLKTVSWAGNELSEEPKSAELVHHVKVYCWKGDKVQM
jgi:hypothetical protein